jgi:hypothetical protein
MLVRVCAARVLGVPVSAGLAVAGRVPGFVAGSGRVSGWARDWLNCWAWTVLAPARRGFSSRPFSAGLLPGFCRSFALSVGCLRLAWRCRAGRSVSVAVAGLVPVAPWCSFLGCRCRSVFLSVSGALRGSRLFRFSLTCVFGVCPQLSLCCACAPNASGCPEARRTRAGRASMPSQLDIERPARSWKVA